MKLYARAYTCIRTHSNNMAINTPLSCCSADRPLFLCAFHLSAAKPTDVHSLTTAPAQLAEDRSRAAMRLPNWSLLATKRADYYSLATLIQEQPTLAWQPRKTAPWPLPTALISPNNNGRSKKHEEHCASLDNKRLGITKQVNTFLLLPTIESRWSYDARLVIVLNNKEKNIDANAYGLKTLFRGLHLSLVPALKVRRI